MTGFNLKPLVAAIRIALRPQVNFNTVRTRPEETIEPTSTVHKIQILTMRTGVNSSSKLALPV